MSVARRPIADIAQVSGFQNGYGFNIDAGLRKWRANASNALKTVLVVGDSITEGYYATDRPTQGYVGLIKAALDAKYGAGGAGFFYYTTLAAWTLTGTWTALPDCGPNGGCKYATGAANTAVISLTGDNFDIYVQGAGNRGTFTVQVDAETPVSCTPTTANTAQKFNITTASVAAHTITIAPPASGYIYLLGATANSGTTGCRTVNVAKSGADAQYIAYNYRRDFILPLAPDLTIVGFGTNDYTTQQTIANFTSRVQRIIDYAAVTGSVLLVGPNKTNSSLTITQKQYEQALIGLARTNNCAFVSIYDRWLDWTTANALGLMYDASHPNTKGHADQANALLRHIIEV